MLSHVIAEPQVAWRILGFAHSPGRMYCILVWSKEEADIPNRAAGRDNDEPATVTCCSFRCTAGVTSDTFALKQRRREDMLRNLEGRYFIDGSPFGVCKAALRRCNYPFAERMIMPPFPGIQL